MAAGDLVRVLPEWERNGNIYAVDPTTQHVPSKVRLVVAFFEAELSTPPWERSMGRSTYSLGKADLSQKG